MREGLRIYHLSYRCGDFIKIIWRWCQKWALKFKMLSFILLDLMCFFSEEGWRQTICILTFLFIRNLFQEVWVLNSHDLHFLYQVPCLNSWFLNMSLRLFATACWYFLSRGQFLHWIKTYTSYIDQRG